MITLQEVEKLAKLSRIKIDENEKEGLLKDMSSILSYIDQIKKATVDTDLTPTAGVVHNVFREDIVIRDENRDSILAEAPDRVGDFISVKKIIEQ